MIPLRLLGLWQSNYFVDDRTENVHIASKYQGLVVQNTIYSLSDQRKI